MTHPASPSAATQIGKTDWSKFSQRYADTRGENSSLAAEARLEEALVMLFDFCQRKNRQLHQTTI